MSTLALLAITLCAWTIAVVLVAAQGRVKALTALLAGYVAAAIFVLGLLFPSLWSEGQVTQGYALDMAVAVSLFAGVWAAGLILAVPLLLYRRFSK